MRRQNWIESIEKLCGINNGNIYNSTIDIPICIIGRKTIMTISYNRGNQYFDTYYIYNDKYQRIGMLEEHLRGVTSPYFVGWKFDKPWSDTGTTGTFDNRDEAINFAMGGLAA